MSKRYKEREKTGLHNWTYIFETNLQKENFLKREKNKKKFWKMEEIFIEKYWALECYEYRIRINF